MRKAGILTLLAGIALMAMAAATPAYADPPGFNGTVKIHAEPGESEPIMANEPHVCAFHIHGFNFDGSATGWWKILAWPPTGDGSTVVASGSWGPASASGEWRSAAMTLPDGHYKLDFDQTNPQAPGGEKHKVFWVECNASGTTTSGSTTSGTTTSGTTGGTTTSGTTTSGTTTSGTTTSGTTTGGTTTSGTTTAGTTGTTTTTGTTGTGNVTTGSVTTGGTEAATTGGGTTGATEAATTGATGGGTAASGIANLPSTSTSSDHLPLTLLGFGLMVTGALLLARRRAPTVR